ncbi:TetR/AcrR family transcriptional regulator [Sunxiuqinia elliptica]|uniref:TetR family transcriptional regulator n=1 Tax=Sunxiuqinia elliptica TaxID=655355 RepID=A0A1I2FCW8_9BACT|nr:TetR/AcrR family transcriptional regulator [Sunxiuqinia elliptica]TDO05127.1 TetR family transcriptional regulator [Sunxiuqinia elliptica]TDO64676.1 TetR family transcriptional regulator [Sunxiuqinia elliptica]SFF02361.1 transcriptional regulator, TetR family [Sunxiuqinia elliptica]
MKDKRQQILETALKLFVENGFHATPTSMIAKEAGVATGTLFHHFKTKEELINTLYLETKEILIQALTKQVNEQDTLKSKFRQVFYNAINWAISHPDHQFFYSQYSYSPFISTLTRELGLQRFHVIQELLKEGQENDILKAIPIGLMIDTAQGTLDGITNYLMEHPEKIDDREFTEQAFSMFWDVLKG